MSKLIHSIDTPQTLRALCLHSFIHKTQSEHLLRTCSIPDTRDPAVNKAGKFSVLMMHTFQRVTDHEIKHACTSTSAYEELTSLGIAPLSKTNKKMGKIHETIFFSDIGHQTAQDCEISEKRCRQGDSENCPTSPPGGSF